jgi:hypothetical protein
MPNFPNYRLGPIDGSVCDTIGFDNHPLCNWRWEQEDTLMPLLVTFTDLSDYEPTSWHWNFGDNHISQDSNPVHVYTQEGVYEVCLVVSNNNSSDTLCRTLKLLNSAVGNPSPVFSIFVTPNPFRELLHVDIGEPLNGAVLRLYNYVGRCIREQRLTYGFTEIHTEDLPIGLYFWEVVMKGDLVERGKAVKIY